MQYWILKTEPSAYSFENLLKDKKTNWDGVRNYQARNNLASMKVGDLCYIYHSVGPKEIVGVAEVTKTAFPDTTTDEPGWLAVEIKPVKQLKNPVHLEQLKTHPALKNLSLVKQSRLSVCPIDADEWKTIEKISA